MLKQVQHDRENKIMARSLNRVQLIGNLTRDPELRYTPSGTAVCSFSIATNRSWTTDTGEKREEVEFHRIVSWNKLAELCSQFLVKGRKVYVEGRLATRSWTGQDGTNKSTTEIVIDDMILLDNKRPEDSAGQNSAASQAQSTVSEEVPTEQTVVKKTKAVKEEKSSKKAEKEAEEKGDDIVPDDIPF